MPLAPYSCGRGYTAHPLLSSVGQTDGSKQTTAAFFYATEALLPAIEAIFTHAIEACRGVDAYSLRESGQDLHHKGNRCFQVGDGCTSGFGKRTVTGGAIIHGPWGATFDGVRALFLNVLPITIRAAYVG